MREKVYLNRVTSDYIALFAQAASYLSRHGVNINFDFVQSDYKNLSYELRQFPYGQRVLLKPYMAQVVPIDQTYDFTSFAFNGQEFPPPNIPTGFTYLPTKQPFMDLVLDARTPTVNYITIIHEHMHALVDKANQSGFNIKDVMDIDSFGRKYYLNDLPDSVDSNFGEQWILLAPYLKTLNTWTYFKPSEVVGLKTELVAMLDKARGIAGVPFKITSGFRTPTQNTAVGGVPNSAHLTGQAADIAVTTETRQAVMKGLLNCGIPIFIEDAKLHIHCDIDSSIHPLGNAIISETD